MEGISHQMVTRLFSLSNLEGNFGPDGSISLSPSPPPSLPPSKKKLVTNTQHTTTTTPTATTTNNNNKHNNNNTNNSIVVRAQFCLEVLALLLSCEGSSDRDRQRERQRKKTKPKFYERFARQTLSMMFGERNL